MLIEFLTQLKKRRRTT